MLFANHSSWGRPKGNDFSIVFYKHAQVICLSGTPLPEMVVVDLSGDGKPLQCVRFVVSQAHLASWFRVNYVIPNIPYRAGLWRRSLSAGCFWGSWLWKSVSRLCSLWFSLLWSKSANHLLCICEEPELCQGWWQLTSGQASLCDAGVWKPSHLLCSYSVGRPCRQLLHWSLHHKTRS